MKGLIDFSSGIKLIHEWLDLKTCGFLTEQ